MRTKLIVAAALALALPLAVAAAPPSIADPPTGKTVTVKGHILSPTGKAVPGVTVSVYSVVSGHYKVARATTSRTGRYEIRIMESEWSYQFKVYDHGDADSDNGDGEWAPTLKRFDFVGSSFRIDQVLHHGARVTGRVYDRTGKPAGAGIPVGASVAGSSAPGSGTLTRADGTFRITNAPAGAGVIGFTSPRSEESTRWYSSSSLFGTRDESKWTLLDLSYGKTTSGIDFRFPYLGTISGDATVDGDQPGEEGSPVTAVLLDSKGAEVSGSLVNPEFRMDNLLPGTYYLEFRAATPEDSLVTEYYKDSSTLAGAVPLLIGPQGGAITGLKAVLTSK